MTEPARHRLHWRASENAFLKAHYTDKGGAFVAAALGRAVTAVDVRARRLGVRELGRLAKQPHPNHRTKLLVGLLCAQYGVQPVDIYSRSRNIAALTARYALAKTLRENGYSYTQIGNQIGRDHTTIIQGLKRYAPCG